MNVKAAEESSVVAIDYDFMHERFQKPQVLKPVFIKQLACFFLPVFVESQESFLRQGRAKRCQGNENAG